MSPKPLPLSASTPPLSAWTPPLSAWTPPLSEAASEVERVESPASEVPFAPSDVETPSVGTPAGSFDSSHDERAADPRAAGAEVVRMTATAVVERVTALRMSDDPTPRDVARLLVARLRSSVAAYAAPVRATVRSAIRWPLRILYTRLAA